jgi:RNA polymerase sigma-70 factor (ECF subfamily)
MIDEVSEELIADIAVDFEAFYAQTWQEIYRAVALAIGEADLAREAVDEAMTRAYERWHSVSSMNNSRGWVYRTAVNWATSRLRRRSVARRVVPIPRLAFDDADPPDPTVETALRALPLKQRTVIVARFLLDMSEQETAKALGVPVGTVKSRTSRALTRLRGELS